MIYYIIIILYIGQVVKINMPAVFCAFLPILEANQTSQLIIPRLGLMRTECLTPQLNSTCQMATKVLIDVAARTIV